MLHIPPTIIYSSLITILIQYYTGICSRLLLSGVCLSPQPFTFEWGGGGTNWPHSKYRPYKLLIYICQRELVEVSMTPRSMNRMVQSSVRRWLSYFQSIGKLRHAGIVDPPDPFSLIYQYQGVSFLLGISRREKHNQLGKQMVVWGVFDEFLFKCCSVAF